MYEALNAYLLASRRPLLICHLAPDADAVGSLLGMKSLLEDQGKDVIAAVQDGIPEALRFLPGWEAVVRQTEANTFDLVISLDSSDLQRLGSAYSPQHHAKLPLINIDHHVTNVHFGTLNIVDVAASSTAEMVYRLAEALEWPISQPAAQCILAGLVADTLCFRTANVTASVLGIAQSLMEAGASLALVNEHLFNRRTSASICIWGKALSNVRLENRIIWTTIPLSMRVSCDGIAQSDTGLASYLVTAIEADVAAVLSEQPGGTVDVGLRAVPGFDVAHVALKLGGGGHPQAAGCTLHMSLDEAEERVLAALRDALAHQHTVEH